MPCSIDTSNGIGGVPVQCVRSQRPADHTLHLHILPHRLRRLAEAVGVSWDLPEVELGGFLQDGGEELVRKGVDCRWHGAAFYKSKVLLQVLIKVTYNVDEIRVIPAWHSLIFLIEKKKRGGGGVKSGTLLFKHFPHALFSINFFVVIIIRHREWHHHHPRQNKTL